MYTNKNEMIVNNKSMITAYLFIDCVLYYLDDHLFIRTNQTFCKSLTEKVKMELQQPSSPQQVMCSFTNIH